MEYEPEIRKAEYDFALMLKTRMHVGGCTRMKTRENPHKDYATHSPLPFSVTGGAPVFGETLPGGVILA